MLRFFAVFLALTSLLAGCNSGSATQEATSDPLTLLKEAAANIRAAKSFRMLVEQTGADYYFNLVIDASGREVVAVMRRAEAQFVSPDVVYATVNLVAGIPLTIDIFARGSKQWLRLPATPWFNTAFAEGFNPMVLIAEDSGFNRALSSLSDLKVVGNETLIDGTPVFHVQGVAGGAIVRDLLVGLVETASDVVVDVYIHEETGYPALVVVTIPDTATEAEAEDTTWRVEIYDYNVEPQLDDPEAAGS